MLFSLYSRIACNCRYNKCFNPLKRVYAFLTASPLIAKNKKPIYSFYFPFNNQISPLLIYRLFENKMFGDNLQYFTKKYPHFTCKNTLIVPPHSGDNLPGFSHLPRLSPNSKIRKKHNHIKTYQIFLYSTKIVVTFRFPFITCKRSRRKSYFNPLKRVYAILTLWVWSAATTESSLCFNPLKRVYAILKNNMTATPAQKKECFNPLKRVYAFLT